LTAAQVGETVTYPRTDYSHHVLTQQPPRLVPNKNEDGQGKSIKKAKETLSLEKDNLVFDTIPVGRTQVLKVTIKNRTPETQTVNLCLEPGSPFVIVYNQLEVKSQSFSRVPLQFKLLVNYLQKC